MEPVALLKALCDPSHSGNFLDCQQRHTGAILPAASLYGSFIGWAESALSGVAETAGDGSADMVGRVRATTVAGRESRGAGEMKAMLAW